MKNMGRPRGYFSPEDALVGDYATYSCITACATNYSFSGEPYWDGLIELNVPADDLVRHEILWGLACDYCFSFYLELPMSPINGSVGCPRCGSGRFHRDTLLPIPE